MPRLPPVPISPHARFRARLSPGVGNSVDTFAQSHSSSSTTSCARPVIVPWPISERAMRITQRSSGMMTTHALTSGTCRWRGSPLRRGRLSTSIPNGSGRPSASPPPATVAEPTMNLRRDRLAMFALFVDFMSHLPASRPSARWPRPRRPSCPPPCGRRRGSADTCRSGRCWSSTRRCRRPSDSAFCAAAPRRP